MIGLPYLGCRWFILNLVIVVSSVMALLTAEFPLESESTVQPFQAGTTTSYILLNNGFFNYVDIYLSLVVSSSETVLRSSLRNNTAQEAVISTEGKSSADELSPTKIYAIHFPQFHADELNVSMPIGIRLFISFLAYNDKIIETGSYLGKRIHRLG